MLKKIVLFLMLSFLTVGVHADDFVGVAVSTWGYFGFYEPVPGERKEITADVLPSGVFLKFFDENYLAQHQDDQPADSQGMVNRQLEVEGPDVFHYLLTIPQFPTEAYL